MYGPLQKLRMIMPDSQCMNRSKKENLDLGAGEAVISGKNGMANRGFYPILHELIEEAQHAWEQIEVWREVDDESADKI